MSKGQNRLPWVYKRVVTRYDYFWNGWERSVWARRLWQSTGAAVSGLR